MLYCKTYSEQKQHIKASWVLSQHKSNSIFRHFGGMLHPKIYVLLIENLGSFFPVKLKGNNSVLDFFSMQVQ